MKQAGFTLIEVMVALSVIAIALMAGIQASSALIHNAERQRESLLAQLCAENALIDLRLKSMTNNERPPVGDIQYACEQAGQAWTVVVQVAGTPNPNIVRLEAQVQRGSAEEASADTQVLSISSVLGPP